MRQQACVTVGLLLGLVILIVGMPSVGEAQTTSRVSVATGGGQANFSSGTTELSADGRFVAFVSEATNLVPGDTNGTVDIFVHDRQTGTTNRVSVVTGGGQANQASDSPAISADGRYVAFDSVATNLVPGDTNGATDVFVHDRQTGTTSRVSVVTGGGQANQDNEAPAISADGRFVVFGSEATNLVLGDTNGVEDVFVHDRQTGITSRVSVATGGIQGNDESVSDPSAISVDGRYVAFASEATNLVLGDTNGVDDVFVHDRQTGITSRVSVGTGGVQANGPSGEEPALSADGRFVAFVSDATNLVTENIPGIGAELFLYDRQLGTTTWVKVGMGGQPANEDIALSADGRFVAFDSGATNLVPGDTNGVQDVFIHDRGALAGGGSGGTDLNGDGKADLVWRNTKSGVVAIWLMNGTTIALSGFPAGVPLAWQITGVGDVNGDGKADVIWRNSTSGTVAVWLMNGLTITSVGFPGSTSIDWEIAQIGDVDGNGTADLVWRNTNSGVVAVWLMNGAAIASAGFLGGVPAAWQIAGIGDVNSDGRADVIWRNGSSGTVAVWLMNGLTISSVGFSSSASTDWKIKGVGDFNGDGKADLIWKNDTSAIVAIWLMNGASLASSGVLSGLPSAWEIEQVGDTNGDGKADVVWQNNTSGEVTVWLMDGLAVMGSGSPGTVSTDWEIQD